MTTRASAVHLPRSIGPRATALALAVFATTASTWFIVGPQVAPPDALTIDASLVPAASPIAAGAAPVTGVSRAATWQRPVGSAVDLASRVGVRITQVAVTGGGGLLDLRVLVLDAERASALHDQSTPPAVVDEATGVVASDLLMGHAHSDPFQAGLTYYFVFENPGNVIQRGGTVSVLLGDAEVDHIQVR